MKRLLIAVIVLCALVSSCTIRIDDGTGVSDALMPIIPDTPKPTLAPTLAPKPSPTPTITPTPEPVTIEAIVDSYIDNMSIEEKIGQLVMFGFVGTDEPDANFLEFYKDNCIGNVILYGANIVRDDPDGGFSRCEGLIDALKSDVYPDDFPPPMVSIDVEGGSVFRFTWEKKLKHAYTLGELNDTEIAHDQFEYIGNGLLDTGINVNLAPCLDVAPYPLDTFLYKRIISSNPDIVARIGSACIDGMLDSRCMTFAKHFPGHGATTEDSHEKTPIVDKTREELYEYDFIPFMAAVKSGVIGIMVTHILYPQIDPDNVASTSDVFINGILREEMGYDGIVISDDFRMDGLMNTVSVGEAAKRFINAGGDIILCGARLGLQKQIVTSLKEAIENEDISIERIDESVRRVFLAKHRFLDWTPVD
ncbi:MAG: glycoside hydrolase family 3 N-terminal domain-containing protein [Clostridia bacterium]|nr:glycoside hydrolase family 3 N-terminal domain-containing protein [Clostridia bacterium]